MMMRMHLFISFDCYVLFRYEPKFSHVRDFNRQKMEEAIAGDDDSYDDSHDDDDYSDDGSNINFVKFVYSTIIIIIIITVIIFFHFVIITIIMIINIIIYHHHLPRPISIIMCSVPGDSLSSEPLAVEDR